MKKLLPLSFAATFLVFSVSGCGTSPSPTAMPIPLTATLQPPTETLVSRANPTNTSIPPTKTSIPTASPIPPPPLPATDTVCASGCDFSTIQAAVNAGGTIIEITDPVHTEAGIVVDGDITVTIRGLGADTTIVQAHETLEDSPERVFLIMEGADVTLEDMTVRHGRPSVEDEHGGGIMNYGTLTVRNCVITANSARGGGGIDNRHGTLTIVGSTIRNNVARGDGPRGVECGGGGGIKCSSGTMRLINSTITANQAGLRSVGLGGGIRTGCGCTAEIVNSTISGNKAAKYGGGIAAAGRVSITNCTITKNTVGSGGGALWVRGEVNLENTIIANNLGGKNCVIHQDFGGQGKFGMTSSNLIEDSSCNSDFSGDPKLGPLADYGGPTLTHALLPGSPAIDAIPAISCTLLTDQRGALRPVVQTSADTPCDIGAFELQIE
jgi:predicted outer membrane repeat protein